MDAVYHPTNREKSRTAIKGKVGWCGCDRGLVGEWGKCPVCKRVDNRRKIKIKPV